MHCETMNTGYSASCGVSLYFPALIGTHFAYSGGTAKLGDLGGSLPLHMRSKGLVNCWHPYLEQSATRCASVPSPTIQTTSEESTVPLQLA